MNEVGPNAQIIEFNDQATRDVQQDPIYDFEHLGLKIAESLVLAAEARVTEANNLLEQTKMLAESIRSQVQIQTEALSSLNSRLKAFGGDLLEAHRKFNGSNHD